MGTGSNLVKMIQSKFWRDKVEMHDCYRGHTIYDRDGSSIGMRSAKGEVWVHVRILFQNSKRKRNFAVLGEALRSLASSNSEQMCLGINKDYGFTEIVIS